MSGEDSSQRTLTDHDLNVIALQRLQGYPPILLLKVASTLFSQFRRGGRVGGLDLVIDIIERALSIYSDNDELEHIPQALKFLGMVLVSRSHRSGSVDDAERAVTAIEQGLQCIPDDDPDVPSYLLELSNALLLQFEGTGSMDLLDRAIEATDRAIELVPDDERTIYLASLTRPLTLRFERTGSMTDINRAITAVEESLKSESYDDSERVATMLLTLGVALERRFHSTEAMDDINRAIIALEHAIELIPKDHASAIASLNNLGIALQIRFERTGSLDDVDNAIKVLEEAVAIVPKDHPSLATCYGNLGKGLARRFRWTGSLNDLDRALKVTEDAANLIPKGHPHRGTCLNDLGAHLRQRFDRTGSLDDLVRSVSVLEESLATVPKDSPTIAVQLNNLGNALNTLVEKTGSMDDINRAVSLQEQAVVITSRSNEHPKLASWCSNLAVSLLIRFNMNGSMDDIQNAIVKLKQALDLTPKDDPKLASRLSTLGDVLLSQYQRTNSAEDRDLAITLKEQAARALMSPPFDRIKATYMPLSVLISLDPYKAKALLQEAVRLLPLLSPRFLKQTDQQHNISQFSGITSRAVSISLQCGDEPYEALQLLELGRGVLASLQIDIRSDISALKTSHPSLAQQFEKIRDQLDCPMDESAQGIETSAMGDTSQNRRVLSEKLEQLLGSIRQLHGFENFLLGPSQPGLCRMAESGPIVVFNVSEIRSDAFLIELHSIRSLQLPLLDYQKLDKYARSFANATITSLKDYSGAKREVREILEWLWDVAVGPVLNELGFLGTPSDADVWTRVWWVGSGRLSILPIHAAGYHSENFNPPRTVIDRVISSYTPTVKALAYARERVKTLNNDGRQRALLVGMQKTPGCNDLPFVDTEIVDVGKLFMPVLDTVVIRDPTREKLLTMLGDHQIIHLACHGVSEKDPSKSRLLLNDWRTNPLTVSEITSLNISGPQFAYLSACNTANLRDFQLLDESIHLASAVQLAGYPSVIGTLWNVADNSSAELAGTVYRYMLGEGSRLDTSKSAEALHRAVRSLQGKTRTNRIFSRNVGDDPLIWAPYIHIGT